MTGQATTVSNSPRGYSTLFLRKIAEADLELPLNQFASVCIDRELPITEIARRLGVTRATVYNWFTGKATPRSNQQAKMQKMMARWQRT